MQHSIWEQESFYAQKDVIIAGSGLGGLWSAYYLKKRNPKLQILIIDKGIIPTGASTRNAGFACFGSVTELLNDVRIMGEDKMLELVHMRFSGLDRINKVFRKNDIDFKRYGGYELITSEQYNGRGKLKADIDWLNNSLRKVIKKETIFRLADGKIKQFGFRQATHLIENKLEGQLHSGKLVQGLLQKIQSIGVTVITGIELVGFDETGGIINLQTKPAIPLVTKKLLICTNAQAKQLIPGSDILPARGQVLITSPINNLPFKGTFHFDEGFYYFRNIGNRVLLGGARNKAFEEEETPSLDLTLTIQNELERFLKEVILPGQIFTIENRWSGIMGMGKSKFPTIQEVSTNCFCALGMGGMGVALAPLVGRQVSQLMLKGD